MFRKTTTPTKTVTLTRRTELPVRLDSEPITIDYDPDAAIAQYVAWVSKELDAGIQYRNSVRHWEKENGTLRAEIRGRADACTTLTANLAKAEKAIEELNRDLGQRDSRINKLLTEMDRTYRDYNDMCRQAQDFLDRARKAEARAEAAEARVKALGERRAGPPDLVERKVWRVRAKAAELAALADRKDSDGPREQAEFWRAARKIGVPVDEVAYYALEKDVMSFYSGDYPAGSVFNTMVYEVG